MNDSAAITDVASTYLEGRYLMPATFCYAEPTASMLALLLSDPFQRALFGVNKGRVTIDFLHGQAYAIWLDREFRPGKEIELSEHNEP